MARNKTRSEETDMDPNAWMVTFGDLLMLLLTFFVMLLSMSSMDDLAVKKLFSVLTGAMGALELVDEKDIRSFTGIIHTTAISESPALLDDGNKLKSLISESEDPDVGATIEKLGMNINVYDDSRGTVISFKATMLFDSGKADIKPEMLPIIRRLREIIEMTTNDMLIVGHTDNISIHTSEYRSNWELSFFRGLSFLNYFLQGREISPERFSVGGAGDLQPRYPNTTPGNREKNRRVEVIFRN